MASVEQFINFSKTWYSERKIRERFFVIALSWTCIYLAFHVFIFQHITQAKLTIQKSITNSHIKTEDLKTKINALQKLSQTPLYKEWLKQKQILIGMRYHYQTLLQSFDKNSWSEVLHTTLKDYTDIRLVKISILPEKQYKPDNKTIFENKIYEQSMQVSIISDYFSTISYINKLKQILPNIFWNQFEYEVIQYPYAKVDMEFSVFYEKQKTSFPLS